MLGTLGDRGCGARGTAKCKFGVSLMITRLMSVVFVTTSSLQLMGQEPRQLILPEQRCIQVRDPERLPPSPIPDVSPPETVTGPQPGRQELSLSLDQAIHIALQNAQVIRVV